MSRKPKREIIDDPCEKMEYVEDLRKFAEHCIQLFFNNKQHVCGDPIPECEKSSEFAVQTVLRTQFDDRCFDFIHEFCLPVFPIDPKYDESTVPWSVHCLLGLLAEMRSMEIPKEQQPGMLLLYFKFCHSVEIPLPPLL